MRWPSLEIFCWSGNASIDWLLVHSIDWLIECSIVWLIDPSIDWLIDWLSARLIVCLLGRLIDWSVENDEVFSPGFTGTAAFTYASHFRLAKVPWMPCDTAERKSWVVQYTWNFAYRTGERCWIKWSVCARTRRWLYRTPEHHSCWTRIWFPCTFRSAIHRRPVWTVRGDVFFIFCQQKFFFPNQEFFSAFFLQNSKQNSVLFFLSFSTIQFLFKKIKFCNFFQKNQIFQFLFKKIKFFNFCSKKSNFSVFVQKN